MGACGAGLVPARVLLAAVALRRFFLSSLGHRHVAVLARPPERCEFGSSERCGRGPSASPAEGRRLTQPGPTRAAGARPPFVWRCTSPPSPARLLGSARPALALGFAGSRAPGGGGLAQPRWQVAGGLVLRGDSGLGLEVGQTSGVWAPRGGCREVNWLVSVRNGELVFEVSHYIPVGICFLMIVWSTGNFN